MGAVVWGFTLLSLSLVGSAATAFIFLKRLAKQAEEAHRARQVAMEDLIRYLSEGQQRMWAGFLDNEKSRRELEATTREVGGLPPELAKRRQDFEERRMAMDERQLAIKEESHQLEMAARNFQLDQAMKAREAATADKEKLDALRRQNGVLNAPIFQPHK